MTESNEPAPQPNPWERDAGQADSGAGKQGPASPEPGQPDPLQGGSGQPGQQPETPAEPAAGTPAQPGTDSQFSAEGHGRTQQFSGQYYAPPGYQPPPAPLAGPAARGNGRAKVVAGVAALVLAVGGLSGALGGYLGHRFATETSSSANALNQPKPIQQTGNVSSGSIEAVAQAVLPSVVQIQVTTSRGAGEGSGFITSADGQIVTNNHVIEGAAGGAGEIKVVFQDGRTADAKILGRDPSSDVAVIKANGVSGLPIVQLGSSSDLKIGQQVVAIGSPFELSGTVTSGIVSSLDRPVSAGEGTNRSQATVLNAIQTDAAINPGNSGGPLVNMQGQVVGINSAIYSPNNGSGQAGSVGIGFAIPIDQARRTADEIVKTGKAKQTVLGVEVTPADGGGAKIGKVTGGGAAEKAGLKVGDVITKFGNRRIDSSDTLVAAVRSKAPGDRVTITLSDGKTVEATLGGVEVE
ncbi:trypsin-like peptidase domain-containing protein [Lentzea sp. NBRC 105346]|uniref:S1C family serine protease n=1 Tax=Lentzea sp. NBRC 105346 TaxID=3032205 RepID=UPI00255313F3|nr:trypsin-like peptidase domain-containing protein [Lentzea sp. NBRC 105346]